VAGETARELGCRCVKPKKNFYADAKQRDEGGVMTLAIMLQGTASDVGKSVLVAGCAAFLSGRAAHRAV
jgi:hypothetical protein